MSALQRWWRLVDTIDVQIVCSTWVVALFLCRRVFFQQATCLLLQKKEKQKNLRLVGSLKKTMQKHVLFRYFQFFVQPFCQCFHRKLKAYCFLGLCSMFVDGFKMYKQTQLQMTEVWARKSSKYDSHCDLHHDRKLNAFQTETETECFGRFIVGLPLC